MTMHPRWLSPLLAAVAIAACSRPDRAQNVYAGAVSQAVPMIEKATGLRFKRPPEYLVRTRDQMHEFLDKLFDDAKSARDIAAQQALLRRLGVIPDTLDLRKLMLDLYTEQVAGLYDPKTKVLYIVEGTDPTMLDFTVQHELVHALQDQYMNLDSVENIKGDDDRGLAAAAVIEGQATLVPLQQLLGPGTNFDAGWDRVRDAIRENQAQMPVMARTPEFFQEIMIFPYLSGAEFVRRFQEKRPGRMPYGDDLPVSTAQIMHTSQYFDAPRQMPLTVTLPAPRAGTVTYDNVMGEFPTKVLLFAILHDQNEAARAAEGWVGDRYALVHTPQGEGIAWVTAFRSAVDAAEFAEAMKQIGAARYRGGAGGRTVSVSGGEVGGHSVVLYVDVPAGARTDLFDLAKVKLN